MLEAGQALADESDVMIGHFLAYPAGTAAEMRRVPYGIVALAPIFPSAHYAPIGMPSFGRWLNPLKWRAVSWVLESVFKDRVIALRAQCNLAPISNVHRVALDRSIVALVAISPGLFPRPPDWNHPADVCGFLNLPDSAEAWEPEPALRAFLDAGPPPAFLSFGSMFSVTFGNRTDTVVAKLVEAVVLAGTRGIIQAPEGVIARAPKLDAIAYIVRAPHARLFPRCSMVVHHGGAGTTQSALLAGRPSVVVPHAADQFYWGDLLRRRGVAPKSISAKSLTAKGLASRIRQVVDEPEMTARAKVLGDALREERGPERAAEIVERTMAALLK
jgi:UDP:flavonoid glycosyltransferase YjiC (YdhE family)